MKRIVLLLLGLLLALPQFFTFLFWNNSAHSQPLVILFPKKIISFEVTGSSSNKVALCS